MQPHAIQQHFRAKPFRPFRIWLDDGTSHEVRDPLHVLVGSGMVFIGVEVDSKGIPDHFEIRHSQQVTRIEPLPDPEARQGGG